MTAEIVALDGPNPWAKMNASIATANICQTCGAAHCCYFCHPDCYDRMPERQTLCAKCGQLIGIPVIDPQNDSMFVCPKCDDDVLLAQGLISVNTYRSRRGLPILTTEEVSKI